MNLIDAIAMLALLQYLIFGALTGRARKTSGLKAPAIVGDEHFERSYRVQMNTLELLVAFIPGLYVAARYWPETFVALLGVVYLIGRFLFARAYVADPRRRGPGFLVSMLPIGVLVISALVGALLGRGAG